MPSLWSLTLVWSQNSRSPHSDFNGKAWGLSENAQLRNRFQARCKKEVRRSKRRTGQSYCRPASPIADEAARKALAIFSEAWIGHPFTLSFDVVATRQADAQDLIQGFFVHLFEQNTLSRADQEKGRLRTFLLGSLQNFLLKERERMGAIKRGGDHQFVSFD